MEMSPDYEDRHRQQTVRLEGPDLIEQHWERIYMHAKTIPHDSIQQFDGTQFHVASVSRPGNYYAVDLSRLRCDCRDFPRIFFCKHMAAVQALFPYLYPEVNNQMMALAPPNIPSHSHMVSRSEETIDTLFQEIGALSQTLATK